VKQLKNIQQLLLQYQQTFSSSQKQSSKKLAQSSSSSIEIPYLYLIDGNWLRKWLKYVMTPVEDQATEPGPISNWSLVDVIAFTLFVSTLSASGWRSGDNVNTILGITYGPKGSDCFATGYSNSQGGIPYYSGDRANHEPSKVFQVGGINMDVEVSADGSTVCVVGPSGIFYGPATNAFTPSQVSGSWSTMVSQEVRKFGQSGFAVIGRFDNPQTELSVNGVAVATSASGQWDLFDIGLKASDGYYARYGSFPSSTTWYVTSGNWPFSTDSKLTNSIVNRVSSRISIYYNVGDNTPQVTFISARNLLGTYPGAISKTTDGGATWTKVYDSNGKFHLNEIDCFDVNNCFATGEDAKSAVILKTSNGGTSWSKVMSLTGPRSLHSVRMISATEVWVGGGEPSVGPFAYKEIVGLYYHSTDGGATWAKTSFNGYGFDLSFTSGGSIGYAVTLFKKHTDVWIYQ
jgi:hypothetical protein